MKEMGISIVNAINQKSDNFNDYDNLEYDAEMSSNEDLSNWEKNYDIQEILNKHEEQLIESNKMLKNANEKIDELYENIMILNKKYQKLKKKELIVIKI